DCDVGELVFTSDTVDNVNLNGTEISSKIDFENFVINKSVSIADMELPEYNVGFPWRMLSNKVNFYINDSTLYHAITDEELADEKLYNSYITAYKKFFSVYKNKGDLKSSNTCYAEMKDVETRRLKYLYEHEGGIDNLLNYQLNVFLKYFAEYGTSPIKSIKISGWVILIFAFFYFFFYSDWDRINRKFLINRGEKLISYFRSEQKLEDLYSEKHKEDINTYSQFKENLKESKTEVPFFFMLFLKPLYWISVIKHQFNSFLYKRVEFLQGRWVDLSAGKKTLVGTATFVTILTYGLYLVAVRSLNSLILSINTFTTLGFGDIPVVGVSRYVAILEGFLGWFLLSIFSVSLISQILQN
ncbi:MAG: two pore domain potassium channel family protein, partial [Flavobacteriales bacterium]|nr:two pore domain potassium channel family protein [Flavobacteriales bacterium]